MADLFARIRGALPWVPYPGPQTEAFLTPADELYYGGAAGGGKTFLAIGLALTQHRNSLILRRQSVDTKGIVEAIRSIPNAGKWKQVGYGGELRTHDGRLVEVGGCQHEADWQKYQGRPHDFIDLDELPQFTLKQFTMLSAWNRVADPKRFPRQRCRVVGGGNPPLDPEGEWVLDRWGAWLDPTRGALTPPGELRWYVKDGEGDVEVPGPAPVEIEGRLVKPRSRTFIPARLEDNPGLLGTGYDATLDALPEPLRSAMRYGAMTAARQDDRWQLIPTAWVVEAQRRWPARMESPGPLVRVGVDVAMQGADDTVLAPLYGPAVTESRAGRSIGRLVRKPGRETPDGQAVVRLLTDLAGPDPEANIDTIGIGKSAYDVAREKGLTRVRPVVVSQSTSWADPRVPKIKFANLRAAMMWNVRAMLDPEGGPPDTRLALPPDRHLLVDLTAPRYSMRVNGLAVESKDDIRERIGRSTDAGDAVGLACWPTGGGFVGRV